MFAQYYSQHFNTYNLHFIICQSQLPIFELIVCSLLVISNHYNSLCILRLPFLANTNVSDFSDFDKVANDKYSLKTCVPEYVI